MAQSVRNIHDSHDQLMVEVLSSLRLWVLAGYRGPVLLDEAQLPGDGVAIRSSKRARILNSLLILWAFYREAR